MSAEQQPRTESYEMPVTATELVQFYGYTDIHRMAQNYSELPNQSVVLAIGKSLAALGEEIAFFRSDIHWVTIDPSYLDKDIPQDQYNLEHVGWDLENLSDIFPEKSFNRIYCYDGLNDLAQTNPEAYQTIGDKLVDLLNDGGVMTVAPVEEDFVNYTDYKPYKKMAIVRKNRSAVAKRLPEYPYPTTPYNSPDKLTSAIEITLMFGRLAVAIASATISVFRTKKP